MFHLAARLSQFQKESPGSSRLFSLLEEVYIEGCGGLKQTVSYGF